MKLQENIKILLVEDDASQAEVLLFFLERIGFNNVTVASNYDAAISDFEKQQPDIALLDITLGQRGKSGIEVGRYIREHSDCPFIFITSNYNSAYYEKAKTLKPHAFLNKEITEMNLRQAVELALRNPASKVYAQDDALQETELFLKLGNQLKKVDLEEIIYAEVYGRYSMIHTGEKKFLANTSLRELSHQLSDSHFARIHKSYLINIKKVDSVDLNNNMVDIAKRHLPIGRSFRKTFVERIKNF